MSCFKHKIIYISEGGMRESHCVCFVCRYKNVSYCYLKKKTKQPHNTYKCMIAAEINKLWNTRMKGFYSFYMFMVNSKSCLIL